MATFVQLTNSGNRQAMLINLDRVHHVRPAEERDVTTYPGTVSVVHTDTFAYHVTESLQMIKALTREEAGK